MKVNDASFELVANDIAHSLKDHGDQAAEARRTPPQEEITTNDLKLLLIVLGEPTRIMVGTTQAGKQSVLFEKKINGTLVIAEIVPSGGGSMQFKTAWKRPSEKTDAVSPCHTSEAVLSPPHSYNESVQHLLEKASHPRPSFLTLPPSGDNLS
ncbi:MAG TPA: hypothetical protein DEQ20_00925 [Desulfobulbaceae bacterium]|nr:MAG: hypothetical protein A2520_06145 [Deltaproteobacteria bacterium RIFOXYD12_FULL_53_23]HCC53480.1 hypothetical protein [Desulfobulbaceae bacterium]